MRTSLAINPWDQIVPASTSPNYVVVAFRETAEFCDNIRNTYGVNRIVLQNNGCGLDANPESGTSDTNHFHYLKYDAPAPKGFQTRTLRQMGTTAAEKRLGLMSVINKCDDMGANFVELPRDYYTVCSDADLQPLHALINANP